MTDSVRIIPPSPEASASVAPNMSTGYRVEISAPRTFEPAAASGIPVEGQRIAAPGGEAAGNLREGRMVPGMGADRWGRKEAECNIPAHWPRPRNR
jgi:hypothetical protein